MERRSIPAIFVGYTVEAKAWLMYDPAGGNRRIHVPRDVTFHESVAGSTLLTAVSAAEPADSNNSTSGAASAAELTDTGRSTLFDVLRATETDSDDDSETEAEEPVQSSAAAVPTDVVQQRVIPMGPPAASSSSSVSSLPPSPPPANDDIRVVSAPPSVVRSPPGSKQRKRLTKQERALRQLTSYNKPGRTERTDDQQRAALFALAVHVSESMSEPRTHTEAIRSPDRAQWERAMSDELDSIKANNTYTLVPLPAGRKAIGCKWVYKVKRHADGSVDRYKARLVAKGYSQLYGIDFTETFAPVVTLLFAPRHTGHRGSERLRGAPDGRQDRLPQRRPR